MLTKHSIQQNVICTVYCNKCKIWHNQMNQIVLPPFQYNFDHLNKLNGHDIIYTKHKK